MSGSGRKTAKFENVQVPSRPEYSGYMQNQSIPYKQKQQKYDSNSTAHLQRSGQS